MLAQLVPAPLVRVFARPYLAGATSSAALEVAGRLYEERQMLATLDLLGEAVTQPEQVQTNEMVYAGVIQTLGADPRFPGRGVRPTVSVKPSAFTCGAYEEAFEPIRRMLDLAKDREVGMTIDMEDRTWTDITLDRAVGYFEEGYDVGTVLQTRLHRTEADLERIPAGMRVRLVIGIYPEPPEHAIQDKTEMKERLLAYSARLLERGARVEFATHDDAFVERFITEVAPRDPERCELQLLLGVPRDGMLDKVKTDPTGARIPARVYVPFATDMEQATAYLRRRMEENPNMMWLVLQNLFRKG